MVRWDDTDFSVLGDSIDLNEVPALSLSHTIGYVNRASAVIVQHLNRFSGIADERLRHMSETISRLETELIILETKLASIPGLDNVLTASALQNPSTAPAQDVRAGSQQAPGSGENQMQTVVAVTPQANAAQAVAPVQNSSIAVEELVEKVEDAETPLLTVQKDPVYAKYFRMVQVGVPAQAVKLKMASEGLDPSLLDTPNAPSPNPISHSNDDEDEEQGYATSSDED